MWGSKRRIEADGVGAQSSRHEGRSLPPCRSAATISHSRTICTSPHSPSAPPLEPAPELTGIVLCSQAPLRRAAHRLHHRCRRGERENRGSRPHPGEDRPPPGVPRPPHSQPAASPCLHPACFARLIPLPAGDRAALTICNQPAHPLCPSRCRQPPTCIVHTCTSPLAHGACRPHSRGCLCTEMPRPLRSGRADAGRIGHLQGVWLQDPSRRGGAGHSLPASCLLLWDGCAAPLSRWAHVSALVSRQLLRQAGQHVTVDSLCDDACAVQRVPAVGGAVLLSPSANVHC